MSSKKQIDDAKSSVAYAMLENEWYLAAAFISELIDAKIADYESRKGK